MTSTHIHTESIRTRTKSEFVTRGVTPDYEAIRAQAQAEAYKCPHCHKPVHPDNRAKHNAIYHKHLLPTKSAFFAIGDMVHIPANEFGKTSGQYQIVAVERIGERIFYIVDYLAGLPRGVSESVLIELNYTPMYAAPLTIETSPDATGIEVVEAVEPVVYGVQAPAATLPNYEATIELMELSLREFIEAGLCGDFEAAQEYMRDFQNYRFQATKQDPLQRIELTNTVVQRVIKSEPVFPSDYELLCIGSSKDIRRGVIEPSKAKSLDSVLSKFPAVLVGNIEEGEAA